MKRLTLALLFLAPATYAFDWPWSEQPTATESHCVGFVGTGLASTRVAGTSRTALWLAWNHLSREGLPRGASFGQDYQAGRERFEALVGSREGGDLADITNGECGLGQY